MMIGEALSILNLPSDLVAKSHWSDFTWSDGPPVHYSLGSVRRAASKSSSVHIMACREVVVWALGLSSSKKATQLPAGFQVFLPSTPGGLVAMPASWVTTIRRVPRTNRDLHRVFPVIQRLVFNGTMTPRVASQRLHSVWRSLDSIPTLVTPTYMDATHPYQEMIQDILRRHGGDPGVSSRVWAVLDDKRRGDDFPGPLGEWALLVVQEAEVYGLDLLQALSVARSRLPKPVPEVEGGQPVSSPGPVLKRGKVIKTHHRVIVLKDDDEDISTMDL